MNIAFMITKPMFKINYIVIKRGDLVMYITIYSILAHGK